MNDILYTKFGTAKIYKNGYYLITSGKEGNNGKRLHRLIFEDYHDCKLDKNDVIHHIDGDKTNNHHTNLICMSKKAHSLLHNYDENHPNYGKTLSKEIRQKLSESHTGKKHSDKTKQKMSESRNSTGYFRVSKVKNDRVKNGFRYRYYYYDEGKHRSIESVSLEKLEEKVKAKGLKWLKFK